MLTISIDPVAFTIGPHDVTWYGIMVGIAAVSVLVIMGREARRLGIKRDIYSIFIWGIIGGIVGARLAHVIHNWEHFIANPREIIGFAGLSQNGMIIGIIAAGLIYMRVTRMRFSTLLSMGDAVAVGAPLGLAIARIGCTIAGHCHGPPSPFQFFPLAVVYTPRDDIPPEYWGVPIYPTQIYHLLSSLLVFAIVWRLRGRFKPEGALFGFFLCIFAAADFGVRFLRTEEPVLLGLRQAQVLALAILAVFLPWLIIRVRRFQREGSLVEPASEAESEQSREG